MAIITNINGTSVKNCKCGTWLNHWKNFSRQKAPFQCPVFGCLNKELVGAHVQKGNSTDRKWYIVPLCQEHNQSNKDLFISDQVELVSADKRLTCDK